MNTPLRIAAAALLAGGLVATGPSSPVLASPTDAAFNSTAGTLNVNYANYLSKHDIVYNQPNTDPVPGLTVGNGRTGAMAWNSNGLMMQVSGVDLSQQSTYAAGLVNLFSNPQMDTGYSTFQQRLSLYDGTLTTKYDSNRTVTVMGSPNSEVMGIHVEDTRPGVTSVGLDLSLWDPNTVQNIADVPDLTTWRTVSTFADSIGVGLSRGQTDADNFGYTLAATVEGASYTSQVVNGTRVRLNITPTASYTIWFTAASRINSPDLNSVSQAKNQLASVKSTGYATTFNNYRDWWHDFWAKSFVQYSNSAGDADYLENVYYLATYMIAAGGYGNYPLHFINGVFRATQDNSRWSNGYWYWNQRDVYNSFFASNHADLMAGFNRLYSRNLGALKGYTQTRYGSDGLWVPETMGWDGNARGTIHSDYVNDIYSTGTEAAYNMYLQYRYTNDLTYLRDTAYPHMREAVKFYEDRLSFDSAAGRYYMASSNAHETYWDVRNAITDLAAVRLLFPLTIQVSEQLGLDSGLRAGWQNIVNNLAPYQIADGAYLPHDPPISQTRNNENVALEHVWPYDQTGIGYPDQQTAINTWNVRPHPYGNVWSNDHVHAARLGLGNEAFQGMRTMLQKYQNHPNGMTNNTNGVFEYLGIHLAAMNESLMQSYNDKIRVFPAVPTDSSFVGKFTLLAKDGFLVSSEREAGEVKYVGIKSLHGKQARVVNPWGTQEVRVRRTSDNAILATSSANEVTFATATNAVYVVERTAKPLSDYQSTQLTGTANQGVKTLSGTASTLGLPTQPPTGAVALRAHANGQYVSATNAGAGNLIANAAAIGSWEQFDLVDLGGGNTALRARVNNQFVCAENAGANPLIANRAAAGSWETFALIRNSDGSVSLRATVNNMYVVAENGGAAALIANRTAIGPWEKFDLITTAQPPPVAAAPPPTSQFEKVKLDGGLSMGEPIELSVLSDGKVLYINRGSSSGGGQVRLYNPATSSTTVALTLQLDARFEDGLIGITLHPQFATNRWVYLFYSPVATPLVNRISRFTFNPSTLMLDPASETKLIEWPTERRLCCHSAGSMTWDSNNNLYFAVGDNTNSGGDSAGMAPIDERPSSDPQYDAQRTSGNTNDLRGKINRIHPENNGTYTIPAGNLFAPGTAGTRPEVYIMGVRNPYRVWVDKKNGDTLYWGEVGPDAGATIADRGPAAYDEFNRATTPGNYGWPYCGGPDVAYNDWDFATNSPRGWFPCGGSTGPVNNSPRNTGLQQLPPTRPALVWEQHGGSREWPALDNPGGCGSPNHAEVYHYDPNLNSEVKWPQYYDNKLLISEYCRNWIKEVQFDNGNARTGNPTVIEPVLAGMQLVHPIDMEFGPDGSLYLLEYGNGYFSGDVAAGLYKINYVAGGRSPIAVASVNPDNGLAPLQVTFSSAGSSDPDGDPLTYAWDFDNNGTTDSTAANPSHTYTTNGDKRARLTVNDGTGRSGTTLVPIVVGNNRPTVAVNGIPNGGVFSWGENLTSTASATDPQDGTIGCTSVVIRAALGHQEHAHEEGQGTGCGFTVNTGLVHAGPDSVLFFVLRGSYTDRGAIGSVPLTGEKEITLWPKQWQAEHYVSLNGPQVITAASAEGGRRLGDIQNGEYVRHHAVSLKGITGVRARVSSDKVGNIASFRYDSPTGPEVARLTVPNTGGWDNYTEVTAPVTKPDDNTHDLYVVFSGGSGALLDLDSYTFTGAGVSTPGTGPRTGQIRGMNKCVDVNAGGTADGTRIQTWDCIAGATNQQWTVQGDGTLRSLGKCMDVQASGTANGTLIHLWTCNGTGAQQWVVGANGSLRNPRSNRCLDIPASNPSNGRQLQIYDCNGTAAQNWALP